MIIETVCGLGDHVLVWLDYYTARRVQSTGRRIIHLHKIRLDISLGESRVKKWMQSFVSKVFPPPKHFADVYL